MSADLRRTYSIRQLCTEFSVTPRALRFYEDKGLLAPERQGLNRIYSTRDRGRLILILRGKRAGFSLAEMRDILNLYDLGDGGAAQAETSVKKFRERITALEAQRRDIDESLESLHSTMASMEAKLAEIRPDLLPRAGDYEQVLRAGLDHDGPPHHRN